MAALKSAGIPVRTFNVHPIHHDKIIVADETAQTGSFNYSGEAASANGENLIVLWHYPALAHIYLQHWQSRWDHGRNVNPGY